jgi:hypothetical protein
MLPALQTKVDAVCVGGGRGGGRPPPILLHANSGPSPQCPSPLAPPLPRQHHGTFLHLDSLLSC